MKALLFNPLQQIISGLLLYLFSFGSWAEHKVIPVEVLADANYPPYSYLNSRGKPAGVYYEVIKRIFARMPDYSIHIRPVSWDGGLTSLKEGKAFALYAPYYRPKARPYILVSEPILEEKVIALCHSSQHKRKLWPKDFIGTRVGINQGFSVGGERFWELVNSRQILLYTSKDNAHNLLKLARKRIDCYINDKIAIYHSLRQLLEEELITPQQAEQLKVEVIVSSEYGYLGYARDDQRFPFREKFSKKFNLELKKMKDSGELEWLVKRFIHH
ncbi:substrate-binding periplasmic protein [Dongshaea marina]|uniref:substrate-binding periplasmic protein n=1 Tax=Dongshaea marina TaxID=2047966 RepID=UPI000D3EE268|nr:transporter substrate-binding domain-containing protein [Dongshaea marina]